MGINTGEWTIASPDGSQVKKYIVALECSVRNITFVEKYTSVSANSRGIGQVANKTSCFGGLGQLYRVKVWAVSGHNISQQPAVRCLTADGQCSEGRSHTLKSSVTFYFVVKLSTSGDEMWLDLQLIIASNSRQGFKRYFWIQNYKGWEIQPLNHPFSLPPSPSYILSLVALGQNI